MNGMCQSKAAEQPADSKDSLHRYQGQPRTGWAPGLTKALVMLNSVIVTLEPPWEFSVVKIFVG